MNKEGAVQIACHTCAMPPRSAMTWQHAQYSAPFMVPYSQQYEAVTFSFYNNRTLDQRKFFEVWQTAVFNINDNSMNFFVEYTRDVKIHQLDREGNIVYSVTLFSAWPMTIGQVDYSYSQNNSVLSTSCTMQYRLWQREGDTTDIFMEGG